MTKPPIIYKVSTAWVEGKEMRVSSAEHPEGVECDFSDGEACSCGRLNIGIVPGVGLDPGPPWDLEQAT